MPLSPAICAKHCNDVCGLIRAVTNHNLKSQPDPPQSHQRFDYVEEAARISEHASSEQLRQQPQRTTLTPRSQAVVI
jgi:hypothetical protein